MSRYHEKTCVKHLAHFLVHINQSVCFQWHYMSLLTSFLFWEGRGRDGIGRALSEPSTQKMGLSQNSLLFTNLKNK